MVVLDSVGCEFFWLWAQNPAWDPANAFHVVILRVHELPMLLNTGSKILDLPFVHRYVRILVAGWYPMVAGWYPQ